MEVKEELNENLGRVETLVFKKLSFNMSELKIESEGTEYDACQFKLDDKTVLCRSAKITPKKVGQFVTCWKRNSEGITEPYSDADGIDFYVINLKSGERLGQFVFPKSELINRGVMSTQKGGGKRGFRVYPKWDEAISKQAKKTQEWQLKYFYEVDLAINFKQVNELYNRK